MITTTLSHPFFTGASGISADVPSKFDVALNGHTYLVDDKQFGEFRHVSIPLLRQQADQSTSPSEASINPDDLWRRAQETWHHGAGQDYRDRSEEADPAKFRSSKGINPWTRYTLELHNDTDQKISSANTNLNLKPAGARLYLIDGSALKYTTDITVGSPTWTTVTGGSPSTFTSLTSDGFTTYATDGADVYSTTTSISTKSVYNTLDCTVLGYCKGRLMAAGTNNIYNITSGSVPSALFTHPNTDFRWVGFTEGKAAIYGAGFSGDKSLIYRILLKPDATGLDPPIVAGELPDGEIIRCIGSYLGLVVLGTDLGWRFAIPSADGSLDIGGLVSTNPVRCFEGQDSFIWYGWTNYDSSSTGLGRMDLRVINEPQTPAYASDLMASGQGNVLSVVTFQNIRVFTVSGSGVWAQDTTRVLSGTIDFGCFGYGLPDPKIGLFLDVRTQPLDGSYAVYTAVDHGVFVLLGTEQTDNSTGREFPVGELVGENFEVRLVLTRDASVTTLSPNVLRWTYKANPAATVRDYIFVPILLAETVQVRGLEAFYDVAAEEDHIKSLRASRELAVYQEGAQIYSVSVEDYEMRRHHPTQDRRAWNGTALVKLKRII